MKQRKVTEAEVRKQREELCKIKEEKRTFEKVANICNAELEWELRKAEETLPLWLKRVETSRWYSVKVAEDAHISEVKKEEYRKTKEMLELEIHEAKKNLCDAEEEARKGYEEVCKVEREVRKAEEYVRISKENIKMQKKRLREAEELLESRTETFKKLKLQTTSKQ